MHLIIQIPCYNEEETLPEVLDHIPRKINGIQKLEIVVIDDGSTDRTADIAREKGVNHIIEFTNHKGLAGAFKAGLDYALAQGADIVVNTDGDHQYQSENIPKLIEPIIRKKADVVIGERPIEDMENFSWAKKRGQRIGSAIVRRLAGVEVKDVTSGFRAYSREAILRITVLTKYTYTWESTIQAGKSLLTMTHVPVTVNKPKRPSRLIKSKVQYVRLFLATILRIYAKFEPLKFFLIVGGCFLLSAFTLFVRFWYFYLIGEGGGHIQSLIFGAVLAFVGIQSFVLAMVADLIASNRILLEDVLYRIKRDELELRK